VRLHTALVIAVMLWTGSVTRGQESAVERKIDRIDRARQWVDAVEEHEPGAADDALLRVPVNGSGGELDILVRIRDADVSNFETRSTHVPDELKAVVRRALSREPSDRYAEVTGRLERHSVASLLALLDETYARTDWLADCARIRCPALIIAGAEDQFPTVEMSARVAAVIPGSRLHVVAGGPHFPNRSHRAEVQSVIADFFATIAFASSI